VRFLEREDIEKNLEKVKICEDLYEGIEYYSEESSYEY
jgi:hypothetical protein